MPDDWTKWLTEEERLGWMPGEPARRIPRIEWQRRLVASREEVAEMKAYWIHPDKADSVAFNLEGRARKAEIERDASRALVAEKDAALGAFIAAVLASEKLHRECGDEPAYLVSATVTRPDFEKHEQALALTEANMRERLEGKP